MAVVVVVCLTCTGQAWVSRAATWGSGWAASLALLLLQHLRLPCLLQAQEGPAAAVLPLPLQAYSGSAQWGLCHYSACCCPCLQKRLLLLLQLPDQRLLQELLLIEPACLP